MPPRPAPRRDLPGTRSKGRRREVREQDDGAERGRGKPQTDEATASRRLLGCRPGRRGLALGGRYGLEIAPLGKLDEGLPRLELAHPRDVGDAARGASFQREPVDGAVPLPGPIVLLGRALSRRRKLLALPEGRVRPRKFLADRRPLVHPAETLEEDR